MTLNQPTYTNKKLIIPLSKINFESSTATLTFASNSGDPKKTRSTAAETSTFSFTLDYEDLVSQFGKEIDSIQFFYNLQTAALTGAPTPTLYKNVPTAVSGTPGNATVTAITTTNDGVTTTSTSDQVLTLTVTTPALESTGAAVPGETYEYTVTFPCASSSVLIVKKAIVNFRDTAS